MTDYQVTGTEQNDEGIVYMMSNGESVLFADNGSIRCRNVHGRNLADNGRFAHICRAMRRAVQRFQKVAA